MSAPEVAPEDVAQTLARYERLAIETGEWAGTEAPEFSRDGVVWLPVWVPTTEGEVPPFVRATVHRKGAATAVAVLAWAEHVPEQREVAPGEIDYHSRWMHNPMSLAGAAALRRAYQRAFRDVIGEGERVTPKAPASGESRVSAEPARDWGAELAAASTADELAEVWAASKGKGRRPEHEVLWRARRKQLAAPVVESAAPAAPEVAVMPGVVPRPPAANVPHLSDPIRKGRKS